MKSISQHHWIRNPLQAGTGLAAAALLFLGANISLPKAMAAPPDPMDPGEAVQVLTRGPIHEAFAETITFNPAAGIVVPKAPPAAIDELPPDQKPTGANVVWIPGYWGWDDERADFLWVSGTWRAVPPGRQWVPGYWGQSEKGYQWTSGYWADAKSTEVEYLPEPPATVEAGPSTAATAEDQSWIPGYWDWNQTRYNWRPGYWAVVQPDWTWIPAHYVWTPRGYLLVDGYWDYSVARRGLLFAPVYFAGGVTSRRGFSYSPNTLINPGIFDNQLFLRPRYQHYYFGDYYAPSYATAGFHPWFSYGSGRFGYDPFYAQQRWQHRQDRQWEQRLQAEFQRRRNHEDARPPRTWAEQKALIAREANANQKSFVVAAPLDQESRNKASTLRFQPVDKQERQRLAKDGQAVHSYRQQRQKLEASAAVTPGATLKQPQPTRVKVSASPIVAGSTAPPGRDQIPPKRHEVLKPNVGIEPTPRVDGTPGVDRTAPQPRLEKPAPQPGVDRSKIQPPVDRLPPGRVVPPNTRPQAERTAPPSRVDRPEPKPRVERPVPQPEMDRRKSPPPEPTTKSPPPADKAPPRAPKAERPNAGRQPAPSREAKDPAKGSSTDKPQRESSGPSGGEAKDKAPRGRSQ